LLYGWLYDNLYLRIALKLDWPGSRANMIQLVINAQIAAAGSMKLTPPAPLAKQHTSHATPACALFTDPDQ
jgi:hypothetical protein